MVSCPVLDTPVVALPPVLPPEPEKGEVGTYGARPEDASILGGDVPKIRDDGVWWRYGVSEAGA